MSAEIRPSIPATSRQQASSRREARMLSREQPPRTEATSRRERRAAHATRRPEASPRAQRPGILFVCTGNICRSALAEVVLSSRLAGVELASAGTHALVGHGMPAPQHPIAVSRGADAHAVAGHRSQQLNEPLVQSADLVLGMSAEHRRYTMQLVPGHLHRIFTALEFARLAALLDDATITRLAAGAGNSGRARLDAVTARLSDLRAAAGGPDDDVIDPYRQSVQVYEASAAQLDPVLHQVERIVRLAAFPEQG